MKKSCKIMNAVCITALATTIAAGAASTPAKPSTHKIYVDGERANVAAYEINDNNYFKLRDVATILSGTDAQFEVTWDQATGNITLTDNQPYTTVGGELGSIPAANQTAEDSTAAVYRDGTQVHYTGFEINDNNYYKLRDIAADFDFGVTWDNDTQSVLITTTEGYTPEGEEPETPVEPEEPETPVEPEEPDDDKPVAGDVEGPAVGTYSEEYEAYLESTGEEIVTVTVDYEIYDSRTTEYGSHGGFPAVVWPMKGYDYLNGGESPFDESYGAYTFMVDEDGKGSFEFKMPKSLYEKTLAGNVYFNARGGLDKANSMVIIDGDRYKTMGAQIEDWNIGPDRRPIRMDMYNIGPEPVITFD